MSSSSAVCSLVVPAPRIKRWGSGTFEGSVSHKEEPDRGGGHNSPNKMERKGRLCQRASAGPGSPPSEGWSAVRRGENEEEAD